MVLVVFIVDFDWMKKRGRFINIKKRKINLIFYIIINFLFIFVKN